MPKYVIERDIPKIGDATPQDFVNISKKSCEVIDGLGTKVQWVHSYVTGDKIYCIYNARNPEIVREHARCGGFPADVISEVKAIIDPTTGEGR